MVSGGTRRAWLAAAVLVAVLVAWQAVSSASRRAEAFGTGARAPAVARGSDPLAGIAVLPERPRPGDYRRTSFGEAWTDDNTAPGGHNGCDTRNDVLDRDLVEKEYVATGRCPAAVLHGTLHDPYTDAVVAFTRGNQIGAAVQIDHIVPLALAWDLGARGWTPVLRTRFANDPANLLAVAGGANQDKGDKSPADWMPPNRAFWCQYAVAFAAVLRGYALPVDQRSVGVLRDAAGTCPAA